MKKQIFYTSIVALCLYTGQVLAANSELAPRKGMSPLDRAKIHSVQAQNWSRIGRYAAMEGDDESSTTTTNSGVSGVGSKTCNTNIGTTTAQKGVSSGRYGPNNNSNKIIVVKGDIISLCK